MGEQPPEEPFIADQDDFYKDDVSPGVPDAAAFIEKLGDAVLKALLSRGIPPEEIEAVIGRLEPDDLWLLMPDEAAAIDGYLKGLDPPSQSALLDYTRRNKPQDGSTDND